MSSGGRKTDNDKPSPSFEEAMSSLEAIVASMEDDDLPLESLLSQYEEGVKQLKICQTRLSEAEVKIKQLESKADGSEGLGDFSLEGRDA